LPTDFQELFEIRLLPRIELESDAPVVGKRLPVIEVPPKDHLRDLRKCGAVPLVADGLRPVVPTENADGWQKTHKFSFGLQNGYN